MSTNLTLVGTSYSSTTKVMFDSVRSQLVAFSDSQIHAELPGGATSGNISVTTSGGTATSLVHFAVVAVTGPTPRTGGKGSAVSLTGFTGATGAAYDGVAAPFTVIINCVSVRGGGSVPPQFQSNGG